MSSPEINIYTRRCPPFFKRIRGAFIALLIFSAVMLFNDTLTNLFTNNHNLHQNEPIDPVDKIEIFIFLGSMVMLLIGMVVYFQIRMLETVVVDERRKKMQVFLYRFNKRIDMGEYDINDSLKLNFISRKSKRTNDTLCTLIVKSGKKKIFRQSNSKLTGSPVWSSYTLESIYNNLVYIKGNH